MASMKRDEALAIVERLGGQCADSVSKKVSFVVVGGLYSETSAEGHKAGKLKKAAELIAGGASLEIISEDDFLNMIEAPVRVTS
jgi:NAD-dependent DNA ligase